MQGIENKFNKYVSSVSRCTGFSFCYRQKKDISKDVAKQHPDDLPIPVNA